MTTNRHWTSLVLAALLACASASQAAALRMLTEDAPPFSYAHDGKVSGLGVDIAEALAQRNEPAGSS